MPAPRLRDESDANVAGAQCIYCGYDLAHLGCSVCPECGRAFKPHLAGAARVPWAMRRHRGVVRAYVETAWELIVRPGTFRSEATFGGAESRRAARRFRNVTAWIVGASVGAFIGWQYATEAIWRARIGGGPVALATAFVAGAVACLTVAVIWGASEFLSGACVNDHDDRRRPYVRAVLLYGCAPLMFYALLIVGGSVVAVWAEGWRFAIVRGNLFQAMAFPGVGGVAVVGWVLAFRIVRVTLGRTFVQTLGAMAVTTFLWALNGMLWWLGVVAVVGATNLVAGIEV